jgi:hypothetical protein
VSLLEAYLSELRSIRSSGAAVPETSYYFVLANLLNEVGKTLKPKVRCIPQLKSVGAGTPDFGLFTVDQFQRASDLEPLPGQKPARGVVEVKATSEDAWQTATSTQVARYYKEYGLVLVTNYRDFLLVGQDAQGKPAILESYRLADSEAKFWTTTVHLRQAVEAHGERFTEFLKRMLLHSAPLSDPKDLAWFLASYARDARAHLEQIGDLPAMTALRAALESGLGIQFQDEKAARFFRSTLVQTLFYGVFSAWVLWHNQYPDRQDDFDWRLSTFYLHVPVIQSLFHQLSDPSRLKSLGLMEFLDRAGATLNRVSRSAFFARFEQGQAVQFFYEPFLEAYDPKLRKELGVWYTPSEVVQYMVARVDMVLRQELGVADGLADPDVLVLDPCCGTGTYLVEVLKRIAATLQERGEDALMGYQLKRAALERVFGFELLPAPFVIAHLQLGLLLQGHGAPFEEAERAGVYLTNALSLAGSHPTPPKPAS